MKKTIIIILILLVLVAGIYLITKTNNSSIVPVVTPQTSQSNINNTTASSSDMTVDIKNFSFSPSAIFIKAGTKVTWTNNDLVSHTITSDVGNLLNSPVLAPGQSFSFIFTSAGTENYHCKIHTMMKGSVAVNQQNTFLNN